MPEYDYRDLVSWHFVSIHYNTALEYQSIAERMVDPMVKQGYLQVAEAFHSLASKAVERLTLN